jgi:hypothetical protein
LAEQAAVKASAADEWATKLVVPARSITVRRITSTGRLQTGSDERLG